MGKRLNLIFGVMAAGATWVGFNEIVKPDLQVQKEGGDTSVLFATRFGRATFSTSIANDSTQIAVAKIEGYRTPEEGYQGVDCTVYGAHSVVDLKQKAEVKCKTFEGGYSHLK